MITPTTKATGGAHDERLTSAEVVEKGLVSAGLWDEVQQAALAVFKRGQEVARRAGLILVDTKYEFGLIDGRLALIDEVHTPDSSRYWVAESYDAVKGTDQEPESFDKEFLRLWFVAQGYKGEGVPPAMPSSLIAQVAERYIAAYERLTGMPFVPGTQPQPSESGKRWPINQPTRSNETMTDLIRAEFVPATLEDIPVLVNMMPGVYGYEGEMPNPPAGWQPHLN